MTKIWASKFWRVVVIVILLIFLVLFPLTFVIKHINPIKVHPIKWPHFGLGPLDLFKMI